MMDDDMLFDGVDVLQAEAETVAVIPGVGKEKGATESSCVAGTSFLALGLLTGVLS